MAAKLFLLFSIAGLSSTLSAAEYYVGRVSALAECYVETQYSGDLSEMTVRSILLLPHSDEPGPLALGPYTAGYFEGRKLYRYQDDTPGALVKDLIVKVDPQTRPTEHAVLYWHEDEGHHDPIVCRDLAVPSTPERRAEVEEMFRRLEP